MTSSSLIRDLIVLCAYKVYQSMDAYPFYCEIGIAVAIALLQMIVDNKRKIGRVSNSNAGSNGTKHIGPAVNR